MIQVITTIKEDAAGLKTVTAIHFEAGFKPTATKREGLYAVNVMRHIDLYAKTVGENVPLRPE